MAGESNLPVGWGEPRKNQMSEHDMKLGGDAALKFATKGIYRNGAEAYKSTDEVKAFYMMKIEKAEQQQQQEQQDKEVVPVVPTGWEDRQKIRAVEAKQYGVFARSQPAPPSATIRPATTTTGSTSSSSDPTRRGPELALVQVATNTLDILASTLEQHPTSLPMEDRAAFAAALKRAMDAISSCR
eukprot:scaffold86834_cov48-Attheya_sp.AAC.1